MIECRCALLILRWAFVFLIPLGSAEQVASQPLPATELRGLVEAFKTDPRGPYQGIRWFCPDGTVLPANTRCPEPGGIQHGLHKDIVSEIARKNGIHLGQILAGTSFDAFLDLSNQSSRLKQYQLERFLQAAGDGWILRKARYYRGAVQAEDEEAWGHSFLVWLLARDDLLKSQFFLLRQACADIPHGGQEDRLMRIRALAKTIADSLPAFMDLRIKIHGLPDSTDLVRVADFRRRHVGALSPEVDLLMQQLAADLGSVYSTPKMQKMRRLVDRLPADLPVAVRYRQVLASADGAGDGASIARLAELLLYTRESALRVSIGETRLTLMDLSLETERLIFTAQGAWKPGTLWGLLQKVSVLTKAAAGCGYLEMHEWKGLAPRLDPGDREGRLPLDGLVARTADARRGVNWCAGMVRAVYDPVVSLFSPFEPLATGFVDDRIRASVLLGLGETVAELSAASSGILGMPNQVTGVGDPGGLLGLNPGYAVGELHVIVDPDSQVAFSPKGIYLLHRAPADMKPVAGIATVTEGNAVSHVQLLARNLGIPNAVVSAETLRDLRALANTKVFYAVSQRGTVVLKPVLAMNPEELALVEVKERDDDRIRVPTDRLDLSDTSLHALVDLRASDSGRLCGPKAANLGQLRAMFPDAVSPGLIIPFGVFRQHLGQPMPEGASSYWDFLETTFERAARSREAGASEEAVDSEVLARLAVLREAIKRIPLQPSFVSALEGRFPDVLGGPLGAAPVFVRSDTNMEDLKDFTGAGLNLTVPNVVPQEAILQAVRDVWASPFTERSYRWRQKYLLNPENVYPSILLLRSVSVDKSGVMITCGVATGDSSDVTVAFSRGVGGAVDGQSAESYLLGQGGTDLLLSPARESRYTFLPPEGGTGKGSATFEAPLLSQADRVALRALANEVRRRLPDTPGIESSGPFDVELGFLEGKIWLFQVRPYVENRRARSSAYLRNLDPAIPEDGEIWIDEKL